MRPLSPEPLIWDRSIESSLANRRTPGDENVLSPDEGSNCTSDCVFCGLGWLGGCCWSPVAATGGVVFSLFCGALSVASYLKACATSIA